MDSQTASPDTPEPDPLNFAAILDNAIIDKIKGNEFSNTARDTFKLTVNNYNPIKEGEHLVFGLLYFADSYAFHQGLPMLSTTSKGLCHFG